MRHNLMLLGMILYLPAMAAVPFKSKEEIDYASKSSFALPAMTKAKSFQGIVNRPYEKNEDLATFDHYRLTRAKATKLDNAVCEKWLSEIFGPLKEITLKVKVVEVFKTKTGEACEAQALDEYDPKAKIPERRLILGMVNDQPTAIVFKLSKKSDAAVQENIRTFWQGLR